LLKKILTLLIIAIVLVFLVVLFTNLWIISSTKSSLYDEVNALPVNKAGLVLGTSPNLSSGRQNLYFTSRMTAAEKLYKTGKVSYLILSGDNGTRAYNEPQAMREALLQRGIPDSALTLDYAGFRTLDSVVRCHEIFGQSSFTIITQEWHNYRAVFIANAYDLNAVAYNAPKVRDASSKAKLREYLARVKAVLDIYVFGKGPKFLGDEEEIGG